MAEGRTTRLAREAAAQFLDDSSLPDGMRERLRAWVETGEGEGALIDARTALAVLLTAHSSAAVQSERERCAKLAKAAVEGAVDAALGEVRRQGGADYLLREARNEGVGLGADTWLGAIASPPEKDSFTSDAHEARWGVLSVIEDDPPELLSFSDEAGARSAYERRSWQWSQVWLVRIIDGPGPYWRREGLTEPPTVGLSLAERAERAARVAHRFGMIDGAHHKQWVIDQMLREMLGEEGYGAWLAEMNSFVPEYLPWDPGIAP